MIHGLANRIMVLFRLAIVVSLAGYTIPNANAAMHGSAYQNVTISVEAGHHGDAHSHGAKVFDADAGHHGDGGDAGKTAKDNCCQDFCFSIALPSLARPPYWQEPPPFSALLTTLACTARALASTGLPTSESEHPLRRVLPRVHVRDDVSAFATSYSETPK